MRGGGGGHCRRGRLSGVLLLRNYLVLPRGIGIGIGYWIREHCIWISDWRGRMTLHLALRTVMGWGKGVGNGMVFRGLRHSLNGIFWGKGLELKESRKTI